MTPEREAAIHRAIMDKLPDHMGYVLILTELGDPNDKTVEASVVSNGRMQDVPQCLRSAADSVEKTLLA